MAGNNPGIGPTHLGPIVGEAEFYELLQQETAFAAKGTSVSGNPTTFLGGDNLGPAAKLFRALNDPYSHLHQAMASGSAIQASVETRLEEIQKELLFNHMLEKLLKKGLTKKIRAAEGKATWSQYNRRQRDEKKETKAEKPVNDLMSSYRAGVKAAEGATKDLSMSDHALAFAEARGKLFDAALGKMMAISSAFTLMSRADIVEVAQSTTMISEAVAHEAQDRNTFAARRAELQAMPDGPEKAAKLEKLDTMEARAAGTVKNAKRTGLKNLFSKLKETHPDRPWHEILAIVIKTQRMMQAPGAPENPMSIAQQLIENDANAPIELKEAETRLHSSMLQGMSIVTQHPEALRAHVDVEARASVSAERSITSPRPELKSSPRDDMDNEDPGPQAPTPFNTTPGV